MSDKLKLYLHVQIYSIKKKLKKRYFVTLSITFYISIKFQTKSGRILISIKKLNNRNGEIF